MGRYDVHLFKNSFELSGNLTNQGVDLIGIS